MSTSKNWSVRLSTILKSLKYPKIHLHKNVAEWFQHPFIIKALSKLEIQGNLLNLKSIYIKSTVNIILNNEKLRAFPLRSGKG